MLFRALTIFLVHLSAVTGLALPPNTSPNPAEVTPFHLKNRPQSPINQRLEAYGKRYRIGNNPLIPNTNCLSYARDLITKSTDSAKFAKLFSTNSPCLKTLIPEGEALEINKKDIQSGFITCYTGEESSFVEDIQDTINVLYNEKTFDMCDSGGGSEVPACNYLLSRRTAFVAYCREEGAPLYSGHHCWIISVFVKMVLELCASPRSDGRMVAEGYVDITRPEPLGMVSVYNAYREG